MADDKGCAVLFLTEALSTSLLELCREISVVFCRIAPVEWSAVLGVLCILSAGFASFLKLAPHWVTSAAVSDGHFV